MKNISLDQLIGILRIPAISKGLILNSIGWNRVAEAISYEGDSVSCDITVKKNWNSGKPESHKACIINARDETRIKSVYDKTLGTDQMLMRIRAVKSNNMIYLDYYHATTYRNDIEVMISDAVNTKGNFWKILDSAIAVPETAEGETVLATLDFGENTWMGQPL